MNTYNMKLIPKYFNYIKDGSKKIELRLNDEKRKNIKIGDIIVFEEVTDEPGYLKTKVIDLYYDDCFSDLIDRFDVEIFANKTITKEELISTLNNIYPIENQKKYGVVGIRIELLNE